MEISVRQDSISSSDIGQHLVKGMNQKMNYFIDNNYVIDLETNIPLRQANVKQEIDITLNYY